jgi:hypothetical protein
MMSSFSKKSIFSFAFCILGALNAHAQTKFDEYLRLPARDRVKQFQNVNPKSLARDYLVKMSFQPQFNLEQRWRAITTMGYLDEAMYRPQVEKALKSKEWFVRNAGLLAVKNGERKFAITWSVKLLRDPALVVRTQAVRNLVELDAREAEPVLWQQIWAKENFLNGRSLWIRAHLAEALAKFAFTGRTKKFEKLLLDEDSRLYKWAIAGLENSTGMKITEAGEPIEIQRQKWLTRLGVEQI